MANLCIKTPKSATYVLIFQLLVLRPRPTTQLCKRLITDSKAEKRKAMGAFFLSCSFHSYIIYVDVTNNWQAG